MEGTQLHQRCLQRCSGLGGFMTSFSVAVLVTQCLLTYMSTQMTTLEREFGLTSAQSGFLYSCNDIGFMLVILIVSFLATKVHIPRFLSGATLLFAVAAVVCSLPYFISREALHGGIPEQIGGNSKLTTTKLESQIIGEFIEYNRLQSGQNISINTQQNVTSLFNSTHEQYITSDKSMSTVKTNSIQFAMGLRELLNSATQDQRARIAKLIIQKGFQESLPADVKSILEQIAGGKSRNFPPLKKLSRFQLMMAMAPVCSNDNKTRNCAAMKSKMSTGLTNDYTAMAYGILIVGMVLQGVAKSPRLSMGMLYLDDNGERSNTPMYIGLFLAVLMVGIILSFGLGTVASKMYVTLEDVDIHPQSPQWIGAWWLGFLVIGALSFLAAIPLLCFPRRMRRTHEERMPRDNKASSMPKEFVTSLKRLLMCPVYMGCVLVSILQLFWAAGSIPFAPKYLETQFSVPAWKANMITGLVAVGSALFGSLLTGIWLSRRKTHPVTMLKIALGLISCTLLLALLNAFVFGCETPTIVGYNDNRTCDMELFTCRVPQFMYSVEESGSGNATHEVATCEESCHCHADEYFPVCGSDGTNYFSACHAGCEGTQGMGFVNCTCVGAVGAAGAAGAAGRARPGLCKTDCRMLVPYLVVIVISHFNLACAVVINLAVKLRAVQDGDRAMALGFSSLLNNLLGWIPGPILFGKLLDNTCLLWNQSCALRGSCAIYDVLKFRISVYVLFVALTTAMLAISCFVLYKAKRKSDWNIDAELWKSRTYENGGGENLESLMEKSPETNV